MAPKVAMWHWKWQHGTESGTESGSVAMWHRKCHKGHAIFPRFQGASDDTFDTLISAYAI